MHLTSRISFFSTISIILALCTFLKCEILYVMSLKVYVLCRHHSCEKSFNLQFSRIVLLTNNWTIFFSFGNSIFSGFFRLPSNLHDKVSSDTTWDFFLVQSLRGVHWSYSLTTMLLLYKKCLKINKIIPFIVWGSM